MKTKITDSKQFTSSIYSSGSESTSVLTTPNPTQTCQRDFLSIVVVPIFCSLIVITAVYILYKCREDVKENNRLLKLILSKGGATADDSPACLPDGLNFPLTTVKNMNHLDEHSVYRRAFHLWQRRFVCVLKIKKNYKQQDKKTNRESDDYREDDELLSHPVDRIVNIYPHDGENKYGKKQQTTLKKQHELIAISELTEHNQYENFVHSKGGLDNSLSNAGDDSLCSKDSISIDIDKVSKTLKSTKNHREAERIHNERLQSGLPVYKEMPFTDDQDRKVSVVKPLKASDHETKTQENDNECSAAGLDFQRLDWNQIFFFLLRKIKAGEWMLFINILLGEISTKFPAHETVDGKVEQIRADYRKTNDCVLMCLKYWKQILADEASPRHILDALKQMGWNDVVQDFNKYMKNPPLLPSKHQQLKESVELMKYESPGGNTNVDVWMLPNSAAVNNNSFLSSNIAHLNAISSGPFIQEIEETSRTSEVSGGMYQIPNMVAWKSSLSAVASVQRNQKRKMSKKELEYQKKEKSKLRTIIPSGKHKISKKSSRGHHKGITNCNFRAKRYDKIQQLKQCVIRLIEDRPSSSKSLEKIAYNTYMKDTIECLVLATQTSKSTILSLKYADYCNIDQFETKRKDKVYVLYAGKMMLKLDKREYDKLYFYVENARKKRIEELKGTSNGDYNEPEALFLHYFGGSVSIKTVMTKRQRRSNQVVNPVEDNGELFESDVCSTSSSSFEDSLRAQVAFGFLEENDISTDFEEMHTSEESMPDHIRKNVEEVTSTAFVLENDPSMG